MKNTTLYFILGIVALAAILISIFLYTALTVDSVQTLPMQVKVSDRVLGLNADTTGLYFGKVPPGSEGLRDLTVDNTGDSTLRVFLTSSGAPSKWVTVSDNDFILEPGERRKVIATAKIPLDAEFGIYNGTMTIIFRKPLFN